MVTASAARSEASSAVESELRHWAILFPDTELPKDHIQNLLDINSSSESPETRQGMPQILRHEFLTSALVRFRHGIAQGAQHLVESAPLPLACNEGRLGMAKALSRKTHQCRDQILHAFPGHGGYRELSRGCLRRRLQEVNLVHDPPSRGAWVEGKIGH